MKATFVKGRGKYDELRIARPDGTSQTMACPKQRIVPHEMVHFAVEEHFAAQGFLARVRAGEAAGYEMIGDAASDAVERLVEVMQGDAWSGGNTPADHMLELYAVTCRARGCSGLPARAEDFEAIRLRLRGLDAQWQALPVGAALALEF